MGFGQESQRGMQGAKHALSIRSGRTTRRRVCTLFAHPSVCTLMLGSVQFPIYKQWGKYTETGVLGATGHFAGAHLHAPLSVWVLVLAANGTGLKVSTSSLEIPNIIASPSATQVWQHLQMSLPVRKIFCVSHPLEWRLPIKCLFPTA